MPTGFAYATTNYTSNTIWPAWVTNATSSTTTIVIDTWATWASAGTTSVYANNTYHPNREAAQRARERQREADSRAEQLLADVISMDDFRAWKARQFFEVRGSDGHVYRIHRGVNGNVQEYVDGEHVATWCAHPRGVPEADSHVAQVLTLRTDAPSFKQTANLHYQRPTATAA